MTPLQVKLKLERAYLLRLDDLKEEVKPEFKMWRVRLVKQARARLVAANVILEEEDAKNKLQAVQRRAA
jgi:hypothetical protein